MKIVLAVLIYFSLSAGGSVLNAAGDFDPPQFGPNQLSGTIMSDGYPVSGAEVTIRNVKTGRTIKASTNSKGRFAVYGLELGLYAVTVNVEGYQPITESVAVSQGIGGGDNVRIELVAEGESVLGVIKGTIKDKKSSEHLPSAKVEIVQRRTGRPYTVHADASGFFMKDQLVPGQYRITVTADGYHEVKKSVTLKKKEVMELQFSLKRR